ncbi:hypothetical protein ACFC26_09660 [Kitasatospora purpeofusca]|uniref:hypothetical protein n=1 Tax=Kitasatospora purpeofusca TaxID=67352 RepID=UPI0035DDF3E0
MRNTWFDLRRHDDPDPDAPPPTGDPGDPGDDALGDAGKKALAAMKAERAAAKQQAAAEKKRADDLAAKVAEFEDRDKSELERATAASEAASARAEAATARAVRAEVKALAADGFADPTDAAAFLDLTQYAGADGEIDTGRITSDLADLLKSKPHLAKQVDGPRGPRPDPGQGARPPAPPADFRTADRSAFLAEAAKFGVRLHS